MKIEDEDIEDREDEESCEKKELVKEKKNSFDKKEPMPNPLPSKSDNEENDFGRGPKGGNPAASG